MSRKHVVTLANSIVGVSVLAMPFCFKQCGVILGTLMLVLSAIMTRLACYFLLKTSTITRRRTYELLAYDLFGSAGKTVVEISIIGFMVGTLIAFLVVMGDLGPEILSELFAIENNSSLRTIILTGLSLFVALPLGLLRNVDSMNYVSTASIFFYIFFVFKIIVEGVGPLWTGSYINKIDYWRPAGVLQCIPIFSMALSCQTQIFAIYDALPEPSLQNMNEIVKNAINLCASFYISVGFLGYIAFCSQSFGGNILMSFQPSWSTQLIKICFLLSIAFSFPLIIFPCRASLHSLLFKRTHHHLHDISTNYIPDARLKLLTLAIVAFTLIVGLLIPNIEIVLGLVGSTTGSVICIIFPSVMFISVISKNTTEKLLAQAVFFVGITVMVLTTYATLYAADNTQIIDSLRDDSFVDKTRVTEIIQHDVNINFEKNENNVMNSNIHKLDVEFGPKVPLQIISSTKKKLTSDKELKHDVKDSFVKEDIHLKEDKKLPNKDDLIANLDPNKEKVLSENDNVKIKLKDNQLNQKISAISNNDKQLPETIIKPNGVIEKGEELIKTPEKLEIKEEIKSPTLDDQPKQVPENKLNPEEILKKLEKHQEEEKKILEEQRSILAEMKQHRADQDRKANDLPAKPLQKQKPLKEEIENKVIEHPIAETERKVANQTAIKDSGLRKEEKIEKHIPEVKDDQIQILKVKVKEVPIKTDQVEKIEKSPILNIPPNPNDVLISKEKEKIEKPKEKAEEEKSEI